jgi:hypothetical protein
MMVRKERFRGEVTNMKVCSMFDLRVRNDKEVLDIKTGLLKYGILHALLH